MLVQATSKLRWVWKDVRYDDGSTRRANQPILQQYWKGVSEGGGYWEDVKQYEMLVDENDDILEDAGEYNSKNI